MSKITQQGAESGFQSAMPHSRSAPPDPSWEDCPQGSLDSTEFCMNFFVVLWLFLAVFVDLIDCKELEDRCLALLIFVFLAPTAIPLTGAHILQDNTNA